MQTTLLAIAVAVILALIAALVGPFFIDWGTYRSLFEKEASRLVGVDVHVRGAIEARLLPAPRLQLNDITIGSGESALRARTLAVEFALGPLMRGDWRADDMRITGPEVRLGLDRGGQVNAPSVALNFDPDALSIDRLSVEDGTAVLTDAASGASVTLNKVWFNGELRSLLGPLKGEGAVTIGGELYPFRVTSGRTNPDGAVRLRLNVDPVNTPLNIETDGTLSLGQDKPQFQGTWSVARPVGVASRNGGAAVTQPWRFGGKVKVTSTSALMEQVDFRYGSDADAIKLSGTAELAFGAHPRFNGVLSARQVDLDKLAGEDDASHVPPAATIRRLAGLVGNAFRPPFPIQLGVGIDVVTLGGTDLQNLRGDVSTAADGWMLDRFEFRAPGFSDVRLSGRLGFEPSGVVFTGPAEIAANDPNVLAAWLEGRKEQERGVVRPLRLRGDVTLGHEKIAVEQLNANFNRGAINGRFVYAFGAGNSGARIDASLNAPELDIDALSAFATAVLAGSNLERPREAALALDIGHASYAGIEAGKTTARLQYDSNGLKIEQLAIENFGGANIAARGQLALTPTPRGSLAVDFDARDLAGVTAIAARYRPQLADRLRLLAPVLAPAKLQANLKLDDSKEGSHATLGVTGIAGVTRVSINGDGIADMSALNLSTIRVQGQAEASDGSALAGLLGVDRLVTVSKEPATLRATLSGNPFRDMALTTWVSSSALTASITGTVQVTPGEWPTGSVYLNVARADFAPLRPAGGSAGSSLPVALTARVTLDGQQAVADDISAVIAGSKLRGKLTASLASPSRIEGSLDADSINVAALIAAAAGAAGDGPNWTWSSTPLGSRIMGDIRGQILLNAMRANLTPNLAVRQFQSRLSFGEGEVTLEKASGSLAGGDFNGKISLKSGADGLRVRASGAIDNGDLAAMLPPAARPPLSGRLNLRAEIEGTGRSPAALVGALHGSGRVSLTGGQFSGLDPRAFVAVTRAVDQGLPVESGKIEKLAGNALDSGQLTIREAEGDLTASAGQIRLANAKASGTGADLALSGSVDLTNGMLDARLVLTGTDIAAGARPDLFVGLHGPIDAPVKTLDVSALTGWLTLRAIDAQAKKLDAIESAARPEPQLDPGEASPAPPASQFPPKQAVPAKPKESSVVKKPPAATTRPLDQAPALPPPINILPFVNAPEPLQAVPRHPKARTGASISPQN